MKDKDTFSQNEEEIMQFYNLHGISGKIMIRAKILKTWLLHKSAFSSINSSWVVKMQRARGVKIGTNCHISPYVLMDLIYPGMITIGNNVTIGSNTMIYAHYNVTSNELLKENGFPRKVEQVIIDDGAVIGPGSIITVGTKIGKNTIIGAGSVVNNKIPDNTIALGNPARVIKKIEF